MPDTFGLPVELTIYSVGEWAPRLRAALAAAADAGAGADRSPRDPFAVDAAAVDEVDAAGVQLLLALANALARDGRRLQLLAPSAALARACNGLGATGLLS